MGILFLQLRLNVLYSQFSCWGFEPESRKSRTISFFSLVCYKTLGYFPLSSYLSLWQQGHLFFFIDSSHNSGFEPRSRNNPEYWVILPQRSQQQTLHPFDFYFCRSFFSDSNKFAALKNVGQKFWMETFGSFFMKSGKSPRLSDPAAKFHFLLLMPFVASLSGVEVERAHFLSPEPSPSL